MPPYHLYRATSAALQAIDHELKLVIQCSRILESNFNNTIMSLETNASFLPPSSDTSTALNRVLFSHRSQDARLSTHSQLKEYLQMLHILLIDSEQLQIGKPIGLGATFYVQEGELLNKSIKTSLVAVKTPRESMNKGSYVLSNIMREVLDEVRVMSYFSGHPNIVTLYGISLEHMGRSKFLPRLIVERALGSLGALLRSSEIPWRLKLQFCAEIAAGLEALHLVGIVHADMKADNGLVFYNLFYWKFQREPVLTAKVGDFGFCVPDTSSRDEAVAACGTRRFKAPEAMRSAPASLRVFANLPTRDIYSFGVLVWEIIHDGKVPFLGVGDREVEALQLESENGAAQQLITSSSALKDINSEKTNQDPTTYKAYLGVLNVISGCVVRNPTARIPWQRVFQNLVGSSDSTLVMPGAGRGMRKYSFTEASECN